MQYGLIISDLHANYSTPIGRLDNYPMTVLEKLKWCLDFAQKEKCTFVIQLGDFFHVPTQTRYYCNKILSLIKDYDIPMFVIPGNHDIQYLNMRWFTWSSLATLVYSRQIALLHKIRIEDVCFYGRSFVSHYNKELTVDSNLNNVLIGHYYLPDVPFAKEVECLDLEFAQQFNTIILGHDHKPKDNLQIGDNTTIYRPGSLLRVASNEINVTDERPVRVLLTSIDGDQCHFEYIDVPHRPVELIYSFEQLSKYVYDANFGDTDRFEQLMQQFQLTIENIFDINDALQLLQDEIDPEVFNMTKHYLQYL